MKTALILPTAFVTTMPGYQNREARILQYIKGLNQVAELVKLHPDLDVFPSDGTIEDITKIDKRLIDAVNQIPNLKEVSFFNDNELGKQNKGAGLIIQLKKALSVIGSEYEYVISFEPRQELEDHSFFERFLSRPASYFRVEQVRAKKYRIFPFTLVQVMTGLMAVRRDTLENYVQGVDLVAMVNKRVSIEKNLYTFLIRNKVPFERVDRLNVFWHDAANNQIIRL